MLKRRGQERFSGTLRIDGGQDGTVTMREGLVIAAATAAAPGPEPLLLRSGRISEHDWTEAFAVGAPAGRLAAELVERELIGVAGLQILAQVAVVDAIFAMALCGVRTCTAERAGENDLAPLLPVDPGLEVERVVRETARRLTSAAQWRPLGLEIHARPQPVAVDPLAAASDVLARVNGRRTTRDIAFALGRGLFPVMNDLAQLVQDGHVTYPAAAEEPEQAASPAPGTGEPATTELPRRRRGASTLPGPREDQGGQDVDG
ncbi:hypothetical protein J4573_23865 [Actinomadura barringtoniae]|uniref:Uncharacterized protein n=1 Tax=Actinomadura barringtoniae TaxID=1427535 RepID=A0A939PCL3_9ACTN|nr:hypothetical protein [Actinomadura barringtoniae]MBO2450161.1 hypothetical protein [Actinomadura barringtoniae]